MFQIKVLHILYNLKNYLFQNMVLNQLQLFFKKLVFQNQYLDMRELKL